MSDTIKFFDKLLENRVSDIHTSILGKIERINGNTADVQPLQDYPLLVNLPLLKQKYEYTDTLDTEEGSAPTQTRLIEGPIYQKGDTVLVVFLERARDGRGNRKHDLSDGIIMGVVG